MAQGWRHCTRASFSRKYDNNMAVGVHCIRPIYICLEAILVSYGTQIRNGCAVNYDSALLTRRQMHFRQIPSLCWKIAEFGAFRPNRGHNKRFALCCIHKVIFMTLDPENQYSLSSHNGQNLKCSQDYFNMLLVHFDLDCWPQNQQGSFCHHDCC